MRRLLHLCGLWALVLGGCELSDEADEALAPDAGPVADAAPEAGAFTLRVQNRAHGQVSGLWLVAESLDSDYRTRQELGAIPGPGAHDFTLDALPPGAYRLLVFQDRDRDGEHDGCPFPPHPEDTLVADRFDNVYGRAEARVADGEVVELPLERHICGPGDPRTGLSGELHLPEGVDAIEAPILLLLEPLDELRRPMEPTQEDEDEGGAPPRRAALRIPLLPQGLYGPTSFSVGELVPGRYRLTFFADGDGDGSPTPCGDLGAGADRYLVELGELPGGGPIEVAPEMRLELGAPVTLEPVAGCAEALTGVRGQLSLAAPLADALADDPSLVERMNRLAGAVRLALFDPLTGERVHGAELMSSVDARPLPQAFTRTGLPPGLWRVAVWIDLDRDGTFTPCGGLPAGLDQIYAIREDVRIREGTLVELGEVVLGEECMAAPTGGVRFGVDLEVPDAPGPEDSGRPLRVELYPAGAGVERRSLPLAENHWRLGAGDDAPPRYTREVPPGRYELQVYLDTNRDGDFTSCELAPYGDRAASARIPVEVGEGVLDLGILEVVDLGCDIPHAAVEPTLAVAEGLDPTEGPLRLRVQEAGGWLHDQALAAGLRGPGPRQLDPLVLAPGRYSLTVYLDGDGDRMPAACGDEQPDPAVGRVDVTLDQMNPVARPEIHLEPACR